MTIPNRARPARSNPPAQDRARPARSNPPAQDRARPARSNPAMPRSHKSWHSRGYLPHLDSPGLMQSITFRLADTLPKDAIARIPTDQDGEERHRRIEALLAAGHGECLLARPELAALVENALLHFDGERYRLLAWCVMPNHVHALISTCDGFPLGEVVGSWKSYTAKAINRLLRRQGSLWHPDYFDRYVRDNEHLAAVVSYIEENPVAAGLVRCALDWEFSSARSL